MRRNYFSGFPADPRRFMFRIDPEDDMAWGGWCVLFHVPSQTQPRGKSFQIGIATLGVVHVAAVLAVDIPQLPEDFLCSNHKAELLAGSKLFPTEETRYSSFTAMTVTQEIVLLKEALP